MEKVKQLLMLQLNNGNIEWENLSGDQKEIIGSRHELDKLKEFITSSGTPRDIQLSEMVTVSNNSRTTQDVLKQINAAFTTREKMFFRDWLNIVRIQIRK